MSTAQMIPTPPDSPQITKLLNQYSSGPIHFAGSDAGLYDRHLLFDNVINSDRYRSV